MTEPAFARDIALAARAGTEVPIEAILVLRLRDRCWLCSHMGPDALSHTLGTLRHRVRDLGLVTNTDLMGQTGDNRVLVPLTGPERGRATDLQTALRRSLSDQPIEMPGGQSLRVAVEATLMSLPDKPDSAAVRDRLRPASRVALCPATASSAVQRRPGSVADSLNDALFLKSEALLAGAQD